MRDGPPPRAWHMRLSKRQELALEAVHTTCIIKTRINEIDATAISLTLLDLSIMYIVFMYAC